MLTVPAFASRNGLRNTNGLTGFAQEYALVNDTCAGDATVVSETATSITYAREINVYYGFGADHPTDSVFNVTCEVPKATATTPPPLDLPPSRVTYDIADQNGQPLTGPIQFGSNVRITFTVDPIPNSDDVTDIRIESCRVTDGRSRSADVVSNGCARAPLGRSLFHPRAGETTLIMTAYWFPGPQPQLSFRCRVRTCKSTDNTCSERPTCRNRAKRSAQALLTGSHGGSPVSKTSNNVVITMPLVIDTQRYFRRFSNRRTSTRRTSTRRQRNRSERRD
ncbi:hypothetical protein BaRGS_00011234 [Batillaria attramentaria]|uniref:ZP domain-containing protein n=1 Tax=Batillaria attramentaria TaxID=370345 RepID=A0ABD0LDF7_9CAEN